MKALCGYQLLSHMCVSNFIGFIVLITSVQARNEVSLSSLPYKTKFIASMWFGEQNWSEIEWRN